jgi:uncharacterized protein (TIGR02266 family)
MSAKTVLVAERRHAVRDRFVAAVQSAGHRAVMVDAAADLLRRLRAGPRDLDLLIVDLGLSPAGGPQLVRKIRELDGGRVPILVFSGTVGSAAEARELAGLGIAGYINEHSAAHQILPALAPHLFPDNFNRRGSPRLVLGIPVVYRTGETIGTALTLNFGKGGLAIGTMSPLQPDSQVDIRFRLPGFPHEMDVEARVIWSDRRAGMGVQFENVEVADQSRIDEFVDQHCSETG